MDIERIKELEKQIEELKACWPAHSVPNRMYERLEELEEELDSQMRSQEKIMPRINEK